MNDTQRSITSKIMLSSIMLNVVMMHVDMMNVVAPTECDTLHNDFQHE
jgi:hypothetical protein